MSNSSSEAEASTLFPVSSQAEMTPSSTSTQPTSNGHARRLSQSKNFFRQFGVQPAIGTGKFMQKVVQKSGGWVGSRIKSTHNHSNGRTVPEVQPEEPRTYQFLLEWRWWLDNAKERRGSVALGVLALALVFTTWPLLGYILWGLRYLIFTLGLIGFTMFLPRLIGWTLSFALMQTVLNGHPIQFRTIQIVPWIAQGRLYLRIHATGIGFANPPGFPHEWFVWCQSLSIQASVPLSKVTDLVLWRARTLPITKNPYYQCVAVIDVESIEFEDIMINFELWKGNFNINEFTRILAEGEVRRAIGRKASPPNRLQIKVIRARDLRPRLNFGGGERARLDPRVSVRCRKQHNQTAQQIHTVDPMWGDEFNLNVEDPSSVLHIRVLHEDISGSEVVGQWVMTTKYLATDPRYCWHEDDDFEVAEDGTVTGWFVLMDRKWKNRGACGKLQMSIRWFYDPEYEDLPQPPMAALEQLKQNSNETNLRMGDTERVIKNLENFPLLFNLRRVTIRGVEFFLQDLFRGYEGNAERQRRFGREGAAGNCVKIDVFNWTKEFRPRKNDPGISVYKVLHGFFVKGLAPKVLNNASVFASALGQTTIGFSHNFMSSVGSFFKGEFDKTNLRALGTLGVALGQEVKNVGHRVRTTMRRGDAQEKYVSADDNDFLMDSTLEACMEKISTKHTGVGRSSTVPLLRLGKRRAHPYWFELRGATIFYRRLGSTSLLRKIQVNTLQLVVLDMEKQALVLFRANKVTSLHEPTVGDLVSSSSAGTMMPPVLAGAASTAGNTFTRLRARTFGRKKGAGVSDNRSVASGGSIESDHVNGIQVKKTGHMGALSTPDSRATDDVGNVDDDSDEDTDLGDDTDDDDDDDDTASVSTAGGSRFFGNGDGKVTLTKFFKARHFASLYRSVRSSTAGSVRGGSLSEKSCPTLQRWFDALKLLGVNHHVTLEHFTEMQVSSEISESVMIPETVG